MSDEADAIIVGAGWVGGILAAELTKAGLEVVLFERGPYRTRDGAGESRHDELLHRRKARTQDTSRETWTLRHDGGEAALPLRYAGPFTPGEGVGGSSLLYGGHAYRLPPFELQARTVVRERYGEQAIPDGSLLADWGMDWDEFEPYYDAFERTAGVSGRAGNLDGTLQPGGNPFEGPRRREFPLPPVAPTAAPAVFKAAAERLGLHPYPIPAAITSQDYTNPDGIARPGCTYCGFCVGHPCRIGAKADSEVTVLPVAQRTGRLDLRTNANVFEVLHEGGRATGVRYHDETGQVHTQRGALVVLSAYALNNVRLLLLSGMGRPYDPRTGEGIVGRNYAYNFIAAAWALYEDRRFQRFMGSGGSGWTLADFDGANFDFGAHGFIGGGVIWSSCSGGGPLSAGLIVPEGTPTWGAQFKQAVHDWYDRGVSVSLHGGTLPHRGNHLDLDPTYTDAWGHPLLRITFDWHENERRKYRFLRDQVHAILEAMDATHVVHAPDALPERFDTSRYQGTHNTGGAIMGTDPSQSVVNTWQQMWDFENVWVVGGSALPHAPGSGPTGTIGALAYRAADGIINHYLRSPGALA